MCYCSSLFLSPVCLFLTELEMALMVLFGRTNGVGGLGASNLTLLATYDRHEKALTDAVNTPFFT